MSKSKVTPTLREHVYKPYLNDISVSINPDTQQLYIGTNESPTPFTVNVAVDEAARNLPVVFPTDDIVGLQEDFTTVKFNPAAESSFRGMSEVMLQLVMFTRAQACLLTKVLIDHTVRMITDRELTLTDSQLELFSEITAPKTAASAASTINFMEQVLKASTGIRGKRKLVNLQIERGRGGATYLRAARYSIPAANETDDTTIFGVKKPNKAALAIVRGVMQLLVPLEPNHYTSSQSMPYLTVLMKSYAAVLDHLKSIASIVQCDPDGMFSKLDVSWSEHIDNLDTLYSEDLPIAFAGNIGSSTNKDQPTQGTHVRAVTEAEVSDPPPWNEDVTKVVAEVASVQPTQTTQAPQPEPVPDPVPRKPVMLSDNHRSTTMHNEYAQQAAAPVNVGRVNVPEHLRLANRQAKSQAAAPPATVAPQQAAQHPSGANGNVVPPTPKVAPAQPQAPGQPPQMAAREQPAPGTNQPPQLAPSNRVHLHDSCNPRNPFYTRSGQPFMVEERDVPQVLIAQAVGQGGIDMYNQDGSPRIVQINPDGSPALDYNNTPMEVVFGPNQNYNQPANNYGGARGNGGSYYQQGQVGGGNTALSQRVSQQQNNGRLGGHHNQMGYGAAR